MRNLFHRSRLAAAGLAVLTVLIGGAILYQIPAINSRLTWRIEIAETYVRGLLNPVEPMPTALPLARLTLATMTPTVPVVTPGLLAETPEPTPSPTPTPTLAPLPEKVILNPPAHEVQDINNCGPATLAMYLRWFGWEGDQHTISDLVKPVRQDRNVNVEELLWYTRTRAGWLQSEFRVGGTVELLKRLLALQMPVMIEEGFIMEESYWPNDDRWSGHYLLLTGYDDSRQVFIGQDSFVGPDRVISYQDLDNQWKAFNRVYFLLFPPERQAEVQAVLGPDWDVNENRQRALEAAQREAQENPEDALAWFNVGTNLVYFEKYSQAAQAYDQARNLGLPQRMLRYQFGPFFAYFHTGRNEDLLSLTEYALMRTPNSEEALLWNGWALYRAGKKQEAIENFNLALEVRADYSDAIYALNYVLQN